MIHRDYLYNELFEKVFRDFGEHLLAFKNERIIFSGKFGTGKTTFLNEFFSEDNQKKAYKNNKFNAIRISPVNYSIANNEDIFEYIKYDVLVEMLLSNKYKFNSIDLSYWENAAFDLKSHPAKFISSILSMVPKIGKSGLEVSTKEIFDSFKNLKDNLDKSYKENEVQLNELLKVQEALYKEVGRKGSLYEADSVTELIRIVLDRTEKQADNGDIIVENVLIIDDLDRIDPEHIFRILNVFAAHFDTNSDAPNKFGFNKIIIVCDINNIREIYSAKYGVNTDFNGYIDKFYSIRIFEYSIKDKFPDVARKIINNAKWSDTEFIHRENIHYSLLRNNYEASSDIFNNIIEMLVVNEQLDIRNVKKFEDVPLTTFSYVYDNNGINIDPNEHPILLRLFHLSYILGDYRSLIDALQKSNLKYIFRGNRDDQVICMLRPLLANYLGISDNESVLYTIRNREIRLNKQFGKYSISSNNGTAAYITREEFKLILLDLIDILRTSKMIR